MSARTMPICLTAGWREAVRARAPYIDVDHLLGGLIAAGGPAAMLLVQHGLTLSSVRDAASKVHADSLSLLGVNMAELDRPLPLTIAELNVDGSEMAMSDRAGQLVAGLGSRATERDMLRALLVESSGTIQDLMHHRGVDLRSLLIRLDGGGEWVVPIPHRCRDTEGQGGARIAAVKLDHFIAADPRMVRSVLTHAIRVPRCLTLPETTRLWSGSSRSTGASRVDPSGPSSLTLAGSLEGHVRWVESRADERPAGYFDLDFVRESGGTRLTLTHAVYLTSAFVVAASPLIRLRNGLRLLVRAQNLSMAYAEIADESP